MSETERLTLANLTDLVHHGKRIAMVTAYDASSAALADAAGLDIVLVGDSAAMTILGHDSTLPVTMDEMLMLTRAVVRGVRRAFVVADMPFGTYQTGEDDALRNAIRFVKMPEPTRSARRRRPDARASARSSTRGPVMGRRADAAIGKLPAAIRPRTHGRRCAIYDEARALGVAVCGRARGDRGAGPAHIAGAEDSHHRHRRGRGVRWARLVWHDLLRLTAVTSRFVKRSPTSPDFVRTPAALCGRRRNSTFQTMRTRMEFPPKSSRGSSRKSANRESVRTLRRRYASQTDLGLPPVAVLG
jgi:3-methyl-2-oxobutanoate hydroxymethyltransferase